MISRYIKLNSVGCYLNFKTGYVFPMLAGGLIGNSNCVDLDDCSEEWFESLSKKDLQIIKTHRISKSGEIINHFNYINHDIYVLYELKTDDRSITPTSIYIEVIRNISRKKTYKFQGKIYKSLKVAMSIALQKANQLDIDYNKENK